MQHNNTGNRKDRSKEDGELRLHGICSSIRTYYMHSSYQNAVRYALAQTRNVIKTKHPLAFCLRDSRRCASFAPSAPVQDRCLQRTIHLQFSPGYGNLRVLLLRRAFASFLQTSSRFAVTVLYYIAFSTVRQLFFPQMVDIFPYTVDACGFFMSAHNDRAGVNNYFIYRLPHHLEYRSVL